MKKLLALMVVGGLLALITGCPPAPSSAPKDEKGKGGGDTKATTPKVETTEGKYEEFKDGKLTLKDKDAEFKDVKDVKAMDKDKKEVKWDDVKKGDKVKVTTTDGKVTAIEVTKAEAAPPTPKVEKIEGKYNEAPKDDKLVLKDKDDKDVPVDVKGVKDVKWEDFKKGDTIIVTTTDGKVTKVEKK